MAITVTVKTLDDSSFSLAISPTITVQELKQLIVGEAGVPADRQRLIFRGRTLMNDERLDSCHVDDGHTIHLVARCV
jgi:hypothetical protein